MLSDLLNDVLATQTAWSKSERFDNLPTRHQSTLRCAGNLADKLKLKLKDQDAIDIIDEFVEQVNANDIDFLALRMLFSGLSAMRDLNQSEKLMCCELVVRIGMIVNDQNNGLI